MAFIGRDVFHEQFVRTLIIALAAWALIFLWWAIAEAAQRRRARVQQQPPKVVEGQDASGG